MDLDRAPDVWNNQKITETCFFSGMVLRYRFLCNQFFMGNPFDDCLRESLGPSVGFCSVSHGRLSRDVSRLIRVAGRILLPFAQGKHSPSLLWPVAWVGMEYVRAHLPFGMAFPWNSLGQSQHNVPYILQNADWGSFYGISFLIVLVNYALFEILSGFRT